MSQRNFFNASQFPTRDPDQVWSHHHSDSHMRLGNASFVLPADGAASTTMLRPNDYPSSSFSNYTSNPELLHDPYPHPSFAASSSRFPPDQVQYFPPPCFSHHGSSMVNPQMEIGRSAFKRKHPTMPSTLTGENTSGYYSTGSSSNLHISSSHLLPKPAMRPQYWPQDPTNITHGYSAIDDSQRNVRSRHNQHPVHVEINPSVAYSSTNMPHHFHGAGDLPGVTMEGQMSHVQMPIAPQGRPSDPGFNHETYPYVAAPSIVNNAVGSNGVFHPNLTQNRNTISSTADGSNGYNQRSNPYRPSLSYTPVGFASTVEESGPSAMESVASSRFSRPLSITGRSGYRNARTRSSYNRSQSSYDYDSSRSRWLPEGAVVMDRSAFYDSRNWFDQHRDMRLDIDNMSYEELLALEERIGNVSTGLSKETISGCLQEMIHCSSDQMKDDDEEEKCAICLENYDDQDELGRLSCRHDFHASCIKNWLLIKNACPICKAAAFIDSPKEKQI
ncbi:uncharacterized protein LOC109850320 isoform X2 [Asparagus officinalis]|nr:uncharacterized protein LOC109850320 isoform X2 [Asparagus officinalis]XP_020275905.1 uncharacterized protein LOC109850320 isoform X2 [Asparagus officinalis]XP_020275906.1 uncharacterized protein LOC109850320 isoform X2 [Asparagus officinalis]XP_020275907.1 uncharacterized protein LOC109850320 isoform X2 [Asparagus officinalis]XP_020275908.1 uncharacterized protein LOC109850320 isoform X2 [Asparagus officinalis]XP_020275909.1 uncharacterized protein LOC109850320 isoform X2 [Asparagus offici